MGNMPFRFRKAPTLLFGFTSLLCMGAPLHARTLPAPNRAAHSEDASAREIVEFNRFLEGHREVAVELHSKPWLVDNNNYLHDHPELRSYLNDHPGVKDEIRQNPVAFMQEDAQRSELAQFSRFLDTHREIAQQLRSNPTLSENYNFLQNHPELRRYLQEHTAVRQVLHDNPETFMQEEEGFSHNSDGRDRDADARNGGVDPDRGAVGNGLDRDDARNANSDRDADARSTDRDRERKAVSPDRDTDQRNAVRFDEFLDGHREIAEQVRKDPSLANNREFIQNHPTLQTFLQNNPGVRDDLRRDPNVFIHQEANIGRAESRDNRDAMHDHMADFGGFLGGHRDIARDLNRDPEAVKNKEFVYSRPDLNTYLNTHPDVRNDLMANPQNFVTGAQQMSNASSNASRMSGSGSGSGSGMTGTTGATGSKDPSGNGETSSPAPKNKQ
ncbi:MAG TPA: hypothetical protein VNV41_13540 [Candidatus Acidoferrales bacterium]|nr:hypothetical protein [Candidatus Acidoferrales bacterium]